MRTATLLLTISATVLALGACGGDDDSGGSGEVSSSDLDGHTYTLAESDGYETVEGVDITLTFEADTVGANAGCNEMSGQYSITDGILEVSQLVATQMFCDGVMDQEQWFSEFLSNDPSIALDGTVLTLEAADVTLSFDESS